MTLEAELTRGQLGPMEQGSSGAFPSEVIVGGRSYRDENAFITSLALLAVADVVEEENPLSEREIGRALDFLERCESPHERGAFRFYPEGDDVARAPIPLLAPDVDDTALVWMTLVRFGRRLRSDASLGLQALERGRIYHLRGDEPSWARPGGYRTWLSSGAYRNPVDVCVNANVAAFFSSVGLSESKECVAACECVDRAIQVTGGHPEFLRVLTPYYAHLAELRYAVQRAVALGATRLTSSFERLSMVPEANEDDELGWPPDRPICCNAHGRPLWRSPFLQRIRALPRQSGAPIFSKGVKQCN